MKKGITGIYSYLIHECTAQISKPNGKNCLSFFLWDNSFRNRVHDCSRSESSIQHATSLAERSIVLHHNRVQWAECSDKKKCCTSFWFSHLNYNQVSTKVHSHWQRLNRLELSVLFVAIYYSVATPTTISWIGGWITRVTPRAFKAKNPKIWWLPHEWLSLNPFIQHEWFWKRSH